MATAPPQSTYSAGGFYGETANTRQNNYGYPPSYGGAPPPYQQPQTRIISNTNPQPYPGINPTIVTPVAQPNVVVVGPRPQYIVTDSCYELERRRRQRRCIMMLLIFLLLGPIVGFVIFIPVYYS